ncbi:MAG: class I SAM-dependent methyltransferase [Candidatus Hodarchaeales archaeon]|jgi:SAM-dependent methyltransferase
MDDQQKELYEHSWTEHTVRKPGMWPINSAIQKILKKNGRILEIGPGNWPKSPISCTIYLELTEKGSKNLKKIGATASTGSIENIPFQDEIFDIVVALEVMEHVPNVYKGLLDVKRVLKKGGYLIFSTPIHQQLWTHFDSLAGHLRRFDPISLLKIIYRNQFRLINFTGRRDPPLFVSNMNALLEMRSPKVLMFISELALTIFSNLHRSNLYRKFNKPSFDFDYWYHPNLYMNLTKDLGNVTLICQKR